MNWRPYYANIPENYDILLPLPSRTSASDSEIGGLGRCHNLAVWQEGVQMPLPGPQYKAAVIQLARRPRAPSVQGCPKRCDPNPPDLRVQFLKPTLTCCPKCLM